MRHRRHTTRALLAGLCGAFALTASACGGSSAGSGLDSSLKYYPTGTRLLLVLSADLESDQFKNLDRIVEARAHKSIESFLQDEVSNAGLSWEKDVKPLLGNELVA